MCVCVLAVHWLQVVTSPHIASSAQESRQCIWYGMGQSNSSSAFQHLVHLSVTPLTMTNTQENKLTVLEVLAHPSFTDYHFKTYSKTEHHGGDCGEEHVSHHRWEPKREKGGSGLIILFKGILHAQKTIHYRVSHLQALDFRQPNTFVNDSIVSQGFDTPRVSS